MEPQTNDLMADLTYAGDLHAVRKCLKEQAAHYPPLPGLCYTSFYDFLDKHGKPYRPGPWTGGCKTGPQLQCYGNALCTAAMYHWRYVEGVALAPTGQLIPHGWNVTGEGKLVDVTWRNTGLVYYGVEFSLERADDATWNGDACVLNDEHRNYPVFQNPWTGEDYTLRWPPSDRIEALRRRDATAPASVVDWLKARGQQWTASRPPM